MADSIAFGGKSYRRRREFVADHAPRFLRPSISSLNFSQGDPLGGGAAIVISGLNLSNATVSFGGTNATVTANSSSSITCTLPAKAAGITSVTVTTRGGSSNALTFEYWDPTVDPTCTLVYDCVSNPYNGTSWAARHSSVAGSGLGQGTSATANTAVDANGAPVFDGNAANENGLRSSGAATWYDYLGAYDPTYTNQPGTVAVVMKSTNTDTLYTISPYGNPQAIGNADQGVIGIEYGTDSGSSQQGLQGHIYSYPDAYKTVFVAAAPNVMHTAVSRFGGVGDTFDFSVDGGLSGGSNYGTTGPLTGSGIYYVYNPVAITMGVRYNAAGPTYQTFAGTVRAAVVLNARCSDSFITKFHKWAQQRHGVA